MKSHKPDFHFYAFAKAACGLAATALLLVGCTNAIPTVTRLDSAATLPTIGSKDGKNFAQINAGSTREVLTGGYVGHMRISQPLADLNVVTDDGYKIHSTVRLVQ